MTGEVPSCLQQCTMPRRLVCLELGKKSPFGRIASLSLVRCTSLTTFFAFASSFQLQEVFPVLGLTARSRKILISRH